MERRVLLAIFLSFLVLYVYQALFPPPPKPPAGRNGAALRAQPGQPASATAAPSAAERRRRRPRPRRAAAALVGDRRARRRVENARRHRRLHEPRRAAQELAAEAVSRRSRAAAGADREHVPPDAPLPFTLRDRRSGADGDARRRRSSRASADRACGVSGAGDAARSSTATRRPARAEEFHLRPDAVRRHRSARRSTRGRPAAADDRRGARRSASGDRRSSSRGYNPPPQPIFFKDGKVTRIAPAKIAKQPVHEGDVRFRRRRRSLLPVGASSSPASRCSVEYQPVDDSAADGVPDGAHCVVVVGALRAARRRRATFFVGPKDFDVLAAVDRDLVRAIDFGMFAVLVVPLLRSLKWVNGYVGNYGWSIIILTILINLVMFPLRHKSVVSMRKMQEIQPEVKAIQDRYAKLKTTDPAKQKMNQELMALYQGARRQPGQRLRADAADAAGALRVLLAAVDGDRAARRAVLRLDSRSVGARSVLRHCRS